MKLYEAFPLSLMPDLPHGMGDTSWHNSQYRILITLPPSLLPLITMPMGMLMLVLLPTLLLLMVRLW